MDECSRCMAYSNVLPVWGKDRSSGPLPRKSPPAAITLRKLDTGGLPGMERTMSLASVGRSRTFFRNATSHGILPALGSLTLPSWEG
jgi:hypothetical protein